MKVLIYRYGSICEPDIISGLNYLGFDTIECTKEMEDKSLKPAVAAKIVSGIIMENKFDFCFSINFFPWLSDICQLLNLKYISLIVDSPVLELYSNSIKNPVNKIFLFDLELFNSFNKFNPANIFHIPLFANTRRIDDLIKNTSKEVKEKYKSDISFIGSTYEEKNIYTSKEMSEYNRGFHDSIVEAQSRISGVNLLYDLIDKNFIDEFLKKSQGKLFLPKDSSNGDTKALVSDAYLSYRASFLERHRILFELSKEFNVDLYTASNISNLPNVNYRGRAKTLTEMPLIFNMSKINLNITSKAIKSGLPLRLFDSLGSGGFTLTNYQSELLVLFEDGKDLVCYEDIDHLKELCKYYLSHEEERLIIAKNGHDKVAKYHNVSTRLLQIIDIAFKW